MRFKVKDLLITILPKKTIIADAECCDEVSTCDATQRGVCDSCTPRTDSHVACGACTPRTDTGFVCGGCTPRTDPGFLCGGCTPRTDTGFFCGGCTPRTDAGARCGGCTPMTDPYPPRSSAFDIDSHRRELETQLRALAAYEKALEEEPSEAELTRAVEALKRDEERLEEALEGVKSLRSELAERLRGRGEG